MNQDTVIAHAAKLGNHSKRISRLEKNEAVNRERINRSEVRISNHGERVKVLETKEAAQAVKIDTLCDTLKKLTTAIFGLIVTLITALLGFAIHALRIAVFY